MVQIGGRKTVPMWDGWNSRNRVFLSFGGTLGKALLLMVAVASCIHTYAGRIKTRDPLEEKRLNQYRSGAIVLGIGDMDVQTPTGRRILLTQSAWFEIADENEIVFFVLMAHKQEHLARLENYTITLRTDTGLEIAPLSVTTRRTLAKRHHITVTQVRQGVTSHSPPSYSEEIITRDLHGGEGKIVFRHPGLVSKSIRRYTLILEGGRRRLHFTWDLVPKQELTDEE